MSAERISVIGDISLDPAEIEESFVRASGPGGQNVNKVSSAVMLRFDIECSPSLDGWTKNRLIKLGGSKVTKDNVLVIKAQAHRDQAVNRAEAVERLVALIAEASIRPKPRRATRPSRAAIAKTRQAKQHRSEVKAARGRVKPD